MRFLLIQVRDAGDPMRRHEVGVFRRALSCPEGAIEVVDALAEPISAARLAGCDVALIGGSGAYSACDDTPWLHRTLDGLRSLFEAGKPLFASCWGFQALARALGGTVVHDPASAEVGTQPLRLTEAGRRDRLFGALPWEFDAQMGHEDRVAELPPGAVLLAGSRKVAHQAYTFADRPIYATQFHAELRAEDMDLRVRQYPDYLKLTAGLTLEAFRRGNRDTPHCEALLPRFAEMVREGAAR